MKLRDRSTHKLAPLLYIYTPSHKPVDDVQARTDNLKKMSEMMLKLPELKTLVNKHLPPYEASQIIANAASLASQGTRK
jgi:hypothetical protein